MSTSHGSCGLNRSGYSSNASSSIRAFAVPITPDRYAASTSGHDRSSRADANMAAARFDDTSERAPTHDPGVRDPSPAHTVLASNTPIHPSSSASSRPISTTSSSTS